MASPQTENGFTRIANELLEAIYRFPFTSQQSRVIWFVIRQTYGFGIKSKRMALDYIAEGTGMDRGDVSRARAQLVALRVLGKSQQEGVECLELLKDYACWELPNKVGRVPTKRLGESQQKGLGKSHPKKERTTKKERKGAVLPGLPQPPTDQHKPFQHVAWGFYTKRLEILKDEYFNPWDPKHQALCKTIVEIRARGDIAEVKRRFSALCWVVRDKPNGYWNLTPGDLSAKWDQIPEIMALIPPSGSEGPVGRAPQTFPAAGATTEH